MGSPQKSHGCSPGCSGFGPNLKFYTCYAARFQKYHATFTIFQI